jgi:cysteine desulfurase
MDRIYLDHNATTRPDPRVREAMAAELERDWGNPSSMHWFGQRANKVLEDAREAVAAMMGGDASEITFTSGGTETNNLAIIGAVYSHMGRGKRIVTSPLEHPSVRAACRRLSSEGFEVVEAAVDAGGRVVADSVRELAREGTVLITIMAANNETGVIQPIEEIGQIARERDIIFHTDAVQWAGKLPLEVRRWPVDLVSISSHKFYGPKGAGAMWMRKGLRVIARNLGGGQERGLRSGTENMPGIAGMGAAAALAAREVGGWAGTMARLRDQFEDLILETVPESKVNGDRAHRVPNTTNISFAGAEGEAILISLDLKGVAISTGSACSTGANEPSPVLTAMGLSARQCETAIRFSLGKDNTAEELTRAAGLVAEVVEKIRSISR